MRAEARHQRPSLTALQNWEGSLNAISCLMGSKKLYLSIWEQFLCPVRSFSGPLKPGFSFINHRFQTWCAGKAGIVCFTSILSSDWNNWGGFMFRTITHVLIKPLEIGTYLELTLICYHISSLQNVNMTLFPSEHLYFFWNHDCTESQPLL